MATRLACTARRIARDGGGAGRRDHRLRCRAGGDRVLGASAARCGGRKRLDPVECRVSAGCDRVHACGGRRRWVAVAVGPTGSARRHLRRGARARSGARWSRGRHRTCRCPGRRRTGGTSGAARCRWGRVRCLERVHVASRPRGAGCARFRRDRRRHRRTGGGAGVHRGPARPCHSGRGDAWAAVGNRRSVAGRARGERVRVDVERQPIAPACV